MQSMVSDLQSDIITLYRSSVDFNQKSAQMIRIRLSTLLRRIKISKAKVYFMARTLTTGASVIAPKFRKDI